MRILRLNPNFFLEFVLRCGLEIEQGKLRNQNFQELSYIRGFLNLIYFFRILRLENDSLDHVKTPEFVAQI